MIRRVGVETGLLLVDLQVGVDVPEHWGRPTGRRNNPDAETRQAALLAARRAAGLPMVFTLHDSREAASSLNAALPTGAPKPGLGPRDGEVVITKDVNGGFFGTNLELELGRAAVARRPCPACQPGSSAVGQDEHLRPGVTCVEAGQQGLVCG
jgi:nicotinamidase-related amidase